MRCPSMDDPFVQDQLTHIKRLREAIQDETAVFYNVFNPVSTLRSSTSDELVYDHLERREPALFEAITRVNEFKMEFMPPADLRRWCDRQVSADAE